MILSQRRTALFHNFTREKERKRTRQRYREEMTPLLKLLVLAGLCHLTKGQFCDETLTAPQDWIVSPNYPDDYPHNTRCQWIINAPVGNTIRLTFLNFLLEGGTDCPHDVVKLYNGNSIQSSIIDDSLCGELARNATYYSTSNSMLVVFITDHSVQEQGFVGVYSYGDCNEARTAPGGLIMSPNFPDAYPKNTRCQWIINAPVGNTIQLTFHGFLLEGGTNCPHGVVKLYNGNSIQSSSIDDSLCGRLPRTATYYSTSNSMLVYFSADDSIEKRGFIASYISEEQRTPPPTQPTISTDCNETLTAPQGVIMSPNYPSEYPNNTRCQWIINAPVGNTIRLTFLDFFLEEFNICLFDFVELYNGNSIQSSIIDGSLCGRLPTPATYYSTSNSMLVVFITDDGIEERGFFATYISEGQSTPSPTQPTTAIDCIETLTAPQGVIMSPNYPRDYPEDTHCQWIIDAPVGNTIRLTFLDFLLEGGTNCSFDVVKIYNGNSTQSSIIDDSLCDELGTPATYYSTSNSMLVVFITDDAVQEKGFVATYISEAHSTPPPIKPTTSTAHSTPPPMKPTTSTACIETLTAPQGVIMSPNYPSDYPEDTECQWIIDAPVGKTIRLTFLQFVLEEDDDCSFDVVELYNGRSKQSIITNGSLCGELTTPATYYSTSNSMLVYFKTDGSVQEKGFIALYSHEEPNTSPPTQPTTAIGEGERQQTFVLAQPKKPKIDESLMLTCVSYDDPTPVRFCFWLQDYSPVAEFGTNCTVHIASVNQGYTGSYVCLTSTDEGGSISADFHIQLSRPLIPRLETTSPPYVPAGSGFNLNCTSETIGELFYNLYKDDILVRMEPTGSFDFYFLRSQDGGKFSCSAVSTVGESAKSTEKSFTVFGQPRVISDIDDPDLGDTLTLTCDLDIPISSDFTIKWQKNLRYMDHNGLTLTLRTLQEEDAGVYSCQLEFYDGLGASPTTSSHGFVIVFDKPLPPSLTVPDDPVMHMSDLEFSCYPHTTEPRPGLLRSALYFNGLKVGERSWPERFIEPALYRAMGSYSCTLFNKRGESSQSRANDITIESWKPFDWSVGVSGWNSAYFARCSSSLSLSFPQMTVDYCSLFVNGERYAQSISCSNIQLFHGSSGNIQCSATNDQGTSAKSPVESVRVFDTPVIRPVNQTPPVMGESYILKCVTNANGSDVTIEWFEDYYTHPVLHMGQDFLIDPVEKDKEHGYRCKVTHHDNGQVYSTFSPVFDLRISDFNTTVSNIRGHASDIYCYSNNNAYTGATLYKDGKRMSESVNGHFRPVFRSGRLGVNLTCRGQTVFGPVMQSDNLYFQQDGEIQVLYNPPIASPGQPLNLTCASTVTENATFVWNIEAPFSRNSRGVSRSVPGRVLNLDQVTHGDSGVYTCQVIVQSPEGRRTLNSSKHIITFSAPVVPWLYKSYNSKNKLVCECRSFDCDPLNPFRLYKDGVLVPEADHDDQWDPEFYTSTYFYSPKTQTFSIDITKPANVGNYTCTAVNYFGESGPSDPVAIEAPVEISLTADNPLASLGDDVTMTCTLSLDTPEYKIMWHMNNKQLFRTGKTLTLNNLTQDDHGLYTCFLNEVESNAHMIALRAPLQPILLHMKSAGYVRSSHPNNHMMDSMMFQAVAEGDQVLLSCFSESPGVGYLPASVTNANQVYNLWSDGQLIIFNDSDGDFTVTAPSLGDHPYRCQSRNFFGSSEISWPTVVKVEERPVIQSSKSPELVNIGDNISLSCETTQTSDGYDITWKKNDKDLLEIRPTLVLDSVNEYDEGIYTCHQKVGSWISPSSAGLSLLPLDRAARPELHSSKGSTTNSMIDGSKLKFYCLSSSTTANIATFKLRGTTIATSEEPDYDEASQIQFTYEMDKVQVSDSGNYTCTVTNGDGESLDSEPFSLTVVTCEAGKWGDECTKDCSGNCDGTGECDKENGNCTDGCKPGYKNDLCDKPCEYPFYGASCKMTCSVNCRNSSIQQETPSTLCHHVHGQCLLGCQGSFYGTTCDEVDDDDDSDDDDSEVNTLTIALIVAVAILVIVAVVLAVLYIRGRRHRTSATKTDVASMSDLNASGHSVNSPTATRFESQPPAYSNACYDLSQDEATDRYQTADGVLQWDSRRASTPPL